MIATKSIADLVCEQALFAGLDSAFCGLVAGCAENVVFRRGGMLFRSGDPADTFYLLRHGAVSLECFVPGHGVRSFVTLGPGEIVGVSWLIPPYRWNFDARALNVVRALAFDAGCLRSKCDADPAIGYALMQRLTPILVKRMQAARLQALDVYAGPASVGEPDA